MRFQSKTGEISETQYAPIRLPSDFPVSGVDVNIRGELPPIPPHIHDRFELGYCYSGEGLFLVEDKILPFRAGDAAIINHREVHVMVSSPGGKTNWSFLNLDPAALLAGYVTEREERLETASFCGNRFPNVISEAEYPELVQPVREIIETRVREPAGFSSEIRSLVWLLLVRLHRAFHFETQSSPPPGVSRLMPALHHIARHIDRPVEIPRLAALCSTSESNFRKLFHRSFGCAPKVYLGRMRLKSAAVMLETGSLPVLEIALRCGYQSLSNFNRQFHACYGVSPSAFRAAHKS